MTVTCVVCHRILREGEPVWASDWKVLGSTGLRTVVRYTCDDCEAKK